MKSADLHKVWGAPDNSRLTAKQYSFRLPVHVAAKIAALCDLYPHKQKTEIVGDLLNAALDELIPNLPSGVGRLVDEVPDQGKVYEETGDRARFRAFANRHFKELERELGTKNPAELYATPFRVLDDESGA